MVAEPRAPYRVAFIAAILLAIIAVGVLGNREAIEAALGQSAAPAVPPCRLEAGQIAHITVRLDAGHLVAQCRIVKGRTS